MIPYVQIKVVDSKLINFVQFAQIVLLWSSKIRYTADKAAWKAGIDNVHVAKIYPVSLRWTLTIKTTN